MRYLRARTYQRRLAQALADAAAWGIAITFVTLARFDFVPSMVNWPGVLWVTLVAGLLQFLVGGILYVYRGRYVYGSFDEVLGVAASALIVTGLLQVLLLALPTRPIPASRPVMAGAIALVLMLSTRYLIRSQRDHSRRPGDGAARTLVFGAGEAAEQLIRSMLRDPGSPYRPIGTLDDDPHKRHLRIHGVPYLGSREAIAQATELTEASVLVVAIADANAALLRDVNERARACGLDVKVIPTLTQLANGAVNVFDVRDIDENDLLGRQPVQIDLAEVSALLRGRRVLITGAGGSIGSELSRQVHGFGPSATALLDRDESALHAVQLSIHGQALLQDDSSVLADIRDADRVREVFEEFRPEVVFHAAALKHLPLLERFPEEAVKTNVYGTLNVLQAAAATGVAVFVNISTDKAANPVSVLGYSKRITERLTSGVGAEASGTYVSVRFGNVLGSRGSVLHAFAAQIESGGPVTVTHPDVTRYFMTIPEAVQLVLQASAIGDDGNVLVLDMGEPVRIADVAQELITASGRHVDLVFTGLRPGEKLAEDLVGEGEPDVRPHHPLITEVVVPALCRSSLGRFLMHEPPADTLRTLATWENTRVQSSVGESISAVPHPSPDAA